MRWRTGSRSLLMVPFLIVGVVIFYVMRCKPPIEGCYRSGLVEIMAEGYQGYIVLTRGKVYEVNLCRGAATHSDLVGNYRMETGAVGWIDYDQMPPTPGFGIIRERIDVRWWGMYWASAQYGHGRYMRVVAPWTASAIRAGITSAPGTMLPVGISGYRGQEQPTRPRPSR
jgi:hypothetical protein